MESHEAPLAGVRPPFHGNDVTHPFRMEELEALCHPTHETFEDQVPTAAVVVVVACVAQDMFQLLQ